MTILTVAEIKDNSLRNVSFEAVAAAAMLGDEVVTLLINGNDEDAAELSRYGADKIIKVSHDNLKHYTNEGYKQAIMQVVENVDPEYIIFGHTAIGKDIAPSIAFKLNAGIITDVVKIDGESFVRPIYSGKAFETRTFNSDKKVLTIRPNNIDKVENSKDINVEEKPVDIKDLSTVISDIVSNTKQGIDLSEAKVIVAGGRGVKSAEGFEMLQELADVLGGAVGASRGATDAEYCDYALQIGQTGKVVTPDLYIACGISGAIQHLAGMSNSKIIVAINKDPEANIFSVADYGIVGDLFEIVPMLTEAFKQK